MQTRKVKLPHCDCYSLILHSCLQFVTICYPVINRAMGKVAFFNPPLCESITMSHSMTSSLSAALICLTKQINKIVDTLTHIVNALLHISVLSDSLCHL